MSEYKFILDKKGNPVAEPDPIKWGRWFENGKERIVEQTNVGGKKDGYLVSTVFLGLDYRFSGTGDPILWETMVFANKQKKQKAINIAGHNIPETMYTPSIDRYSTRHTSREDAQKYHEETVLKIKKLYGSKRKRKPAK